MGIMDCCYHAVPVVRLLRKVLPLDWPLGGYGVLVLPPMSARAARVGEWFGLLRSLGDSSHAGHMEESSNRSFALAFLRFEHNLINGQSFQL